MTPSRPFDRPSEMRLETRMTETKRMIVSKSEKKSVRGLLMIQPRMTRIGTGEGKGGQLWPWMNCLIRRTHSCRRRSGCWIQRRRPS